MCDTVPFVIIGVETTVLHPPSQQTRQLFTRLMEAELYDDRYGEYDAGLMGLYARLFNEDEMAAEAVWLVYRRDEPSKLLGVAAWMIGSRLEQPSLHRYVIPEYRGGGIGTALQAIGDDYQNYSRTNHAYG